MTAPITHKARRLRRQPTDAEVRLWQYLRRRQLAGCRFRRQYPVGPYIVDFACLEPRLVVEVDGGQHAAALEYDRHRSAFLASRGYRVLRYWNNQVLHETAAVVADIAQYLSSPP